MVSKNKMETDCGSDHELLITKFRLKLKKVGKTTRLFSYESESENEVAQSCLTLSDAMDCSLPGSSLYGILQARVLEWVAYQAPPSMGFSRQEYWSGLPFPSPGDLPDPGIEPGSPTFQENALTSEPPGHSFLQGIFRYNLNQITHDYTVKVTNKFKGLELIECLKNYGQRFLTLYSTW